MSASLIFDIVPLGSLVAYSDGQPALDLLTDAAEHGTASTAEAIDHLHARLHAAMPRAYW